LVVCGINTNTTAITGCKDDCGAVPVSPNTNPLTG